MICIQNSVSGQDSKINSLPYIKSIYLEGVDNYCRIYPKPDYNLVQRGRKILQNETETTMYMAFYGAHHIIKLISAFESIDPAILINKTISIYDWGCGQGIGSLVLMEYFQSKKVNLNIKNIDLIEPSAVSLNLSKKYLEGLINNYKINRPEITGINKDFNSLSSVHFSKNQTEISIHLFSNILDIESYDFNQLYACVKSTQCSQNLFVCVGPSYSSSKRNMDRINKIVVDNMAIKNILNREMTYNINAFCCFARTFRNRPVTSIEKVFQIN